MRWSAWVVIIMASFITTMSVSNPNVAVMSSDSLLPPPPPPPSSSSSSLSDSPSCQTIHTKRHHRFYLLDPPSYLSPAVQALKGTLHVLTPPRNARTKGPFKPRSATKGTSSYQLRQFAEATLGSGSLRKAVKLPEGEDLNEWLAVNGTLRLATHQRRLLY